MTPGSCIERPAPASAKGCCRRFLLKMTLRYIEPQGALTAQRLLEASERLGHGDCYFPALLHAVEG